VRQSPLSTSTISGPIVPAPDEKCVRRSWHNVKWQEKTRRNVTLSTINPIDLTWYRNRAAGIGS
jgi:hypothetical protein